MSIKKLLLASVVAAVGLAQADVLYWQVDKPQIKDWSDSGRTDVSQRPAETQPTWTYAQLVDNSGNAYQLYYEDINGNLQSLGGDSVSLDNGTGKSGSGEIYPIYADIGTSASGKSFMIELMNSDGLVATSDSVSYTDLQSQGYIAAGSQLSTPTLYQAWNGGTYTIPEPTSGLLFLVGGSLLALRRRKRA